jgi:hypothetical protein
MSMYNMIHGYNPLAGVLMKILDVTPNKIPRFRDCYFDGEHIVIYTRTGGGNREFYDEPNEDNKDGPWNSDLRQLPGYVRDEDDDFDSTYASFYFSVPEQFGYLVDKLKSMAQKETQSEKWEATLERIKNGNPDDPFMKRMLESFAPVFQSIEKHLSESE